MLATPAAARALPFIGGNISFRKSPESLSNKEQIISLLFARYRVLASPLATSSRSFCLAYSTLVCYIFWSPSKLLSPLSYTDSRERERERLKPLQDIIFGFTNVFFQKNNSSGDQIQNLDPKCKCHFGAKKHLDFSFSNKLQIFRKYFSLEIS